MQPAFGSVKRRRATITRARHLLGAATPIASSDDSPAVDVDRTRCPLCHQGHWQVVEILRPLAAAVVPMPFNTS